MSAHVDPPSIDVTAKVIGVLESIGVDAECIGPSSENVWTKLSLGGVPARMRFAEEIAHSRGVRLFRMGAKKRFDKLPATEDDTADLLSELFLHFRSRLADDDIKPYVTKKALVATAFFNARVDPHLGDYVAGFEVKLGFIKGDS